LGFLPEGIPGRGLGFVFGSNPMPAVFDLDANLGCGDGVQDYGIALGSCGQPDPVFDSLSWFPETAGVLCVTPAGSDTGRLELTVLGVTRESLTVLVREVDPALTVTFDGWLPRIVDIAALEPNASHRLLVSLTDGNTVPVSAEAEFLHQEETTMAIGSAPLAVIVVEPVVECNQAGGALVTLDGSRSRDPDDGGRVVSYEWWSGGGTGQGTLLGTGAVLDVFFPLGPNAVSLRVVDGDGMTAGASTEITIRDTTPPLMEVDLDRREIWPPDHRLVPVQIVTEVIDVCDPGARAVLASVGSSEPDDDPGGGDGQTTRDIADALVGTPDARVLLRAERLATGPGRTYSLTYEVTDLSGNRTVKTSEVLVPRDAAGPTATTQSASSSP